MCTSASLGRAFTYRCRYIITRTSPWAVDTGWNSAFLQRRLRHKCSWPRFSQVILCSPAALQTVPCRICHGRKQKPPNLSLVRKRIRRGLELPGLGGEQVGLWEDLGQPDGRAPGLQPSGVNLSNCQAKYCKSLAITETVKGQMQFPELFTQSEAPPPFSKCQE